MHNCKKASSIFLGFLFLLAIPRISSSQVRLIQTFLEQNAIGHDELGRCVSGAGDVNNDGYDDIIVGAYGYNNYTGRVYLYFGRSSMHGTPDMILDGKGTSNYFGASISGAGDVNNDGYDDIIVGSYGYDAQAGGAFIYYGGSTMDSTADLLLTGDGVSRDFGYSVSGAGDVNNDGYDDLVIGAILYNSSTGRAFIYYGGNPMDTTADVVMTGKVTNENFGCSVSGAGDVNNDGYDDVIIGAYGYTTSTGRAYIYYGGSPMDTTADVTMTGEATANYFGMSVSNAGNVNNDSCADVIVGAPGYGSSVGRAYIYYGGSSMNNVPDVIITGKGASDLLGQSVSGAGNVNNDLYDDVIVGAYGCDSVRGCAYIYYGGTSMDTTADVVLTGEKTKDRFGYSVSDAGDINNDNYDDVIVGANYYNSNTGRAYLFEGGTPMDTVADFVVTGEGADNNLGFSVSGAGDVNKDGYDDIVIGAYKYISYTGSAYVYYGGRSMDGMADVTMVGTQMNEKFGTSVSDAGDLNRDGYDDIIIGAPGFDSNTGRTYIYYGGSHMDSTAELILTGEGTNDYFGCSVSGAGRVNNDVYSDIIVGSYGFDSSTGRAYIYFGGNPMNDTADVIMDGEQTGDNFGFSVSGAGNVSNDQYNDVIIGAYGYNSNTGRAYIYYNGGSIYSTMTGEAQNDQFGYSVSGAGDLNGDGFDDIVVGAGNHNSSRGKAYVYFGNSTMTMTINGETSGDRFGYSVSGAGDLNHDGYDDLIIGAYGSNSYTGRAYIYYGGISMHNTADITIDGEATNDWFGYSVSGAGDVDGDGYDDVIIGANLFPTNGKAYIYSNPGPPVAVNGGQTLGPGKFELRQNYPNPFNPTTSIEFNVGIQGRTSLRIYDILGREVATLVNDIRPAGSYRVVWDPANLPSGMYFSCLENGGQKQTRKIVLIK